LKFHNNNFKSIYRWDGAILTLWKWKIRLKN